MSRNRTMLCAAVAAAALLVAGCTGDEPDTDPSTSTGQDAGDLALNFHPAVGDRGDDAVDVLAV